MRRLSLFAAAGLVLVLLVSSLASSSSPAASSMTPKREPGRLVDVASAAALGVRVRSAKRPTIVNFWATWCGPCVAEIPDLVALEARYAKTGVAVLGVSLDAWVPGTLAAQRRKVERFLDYKKISYDNVLFTGKQDDLLERFDLSGSLPATILYSGNGEELWRYDGRLDPKSLAEQLEKLPALQSRTSN